MSLDTGAWFVGREEKNETKKKEGTDIDTDKGMANVIGMDTETNTEPYAEPPTVNNVNVLKEISRDIVFTDQISTPKNICCSWRPFTSCNVSCDDRKRMCQGDLKQTETVTKVCNE